MPSPIDCTPASRAPRLAASIAPGPAAGDDREAGLAQMARELARLLRTPGGRGGVRAEPKMRHRLADVRERAEAAPQLLGDVADPRLVVEQRQDGRRLRAEDLLVGRRRVLARRLVLRRGDGMLVGHGGEG